MASFDFLTGDHHMLLITVFKRELFVTLFLQEIVSLVNRNENNRACNAFNILLGLKFDMALIGRAKKADSPEIGSFQEIHNAVAMFATGQASPDDTQRFFLMLRKKPDFTRSVCDLQQLSDLSTKAGDKYQSRRLRKALFDNGGGSMLEESRLRCPKIYVTIAEVLAARRERRTHTASGRNAADLLFSKNTLLMTTHLSTPTFEPMTMRQIPQAIQESNRVPRSTRGPQVCR